MFFRFDKYLHAAERKFEVAYEWELMGAAFVDAKCQGFTCAVFVNTFFVSSASEAASAWEEAMGLLSSYFKQWRHDEGDAIYLVP